MKMKMVCLRNGKEYDTEKAEPVFTLWNGAVDEPGSMFQELYKTEDNDWFILRIRTQVNSISGELVVRKFIYKPDEISIVNWLIVEGCDIETVKQVIMNMANAGKVG